MRSDDQATTISLRAYGRHRKCSHEAVRRAIAAGRLVESVVRNPTTGRVAGIVQELADREWAAATDPTKPTGVDPSPKPEDPAPPMLFPELQKRARPTPEELEALQAKKTGAKALAARALFSAQLLEIELAEKRGKLVRVAEVEERYFDLARQIRNLLLAIPARIAALLAAESEESAVREQLEQEIRGALASLADEPQNPINEQEPTQ